MSSPQGIPIPQVFVLWHPRCRLGEALARRILQWLRPGNGLGPEVFYRSLPAPGAPANGLPPPLPRRTRATALKTRESVTDLQIALLLIDENMVADLAWRRWLEELIRPPESAQEPSKEIMPIALDATAYNTPPALRELNYLRPTGLPLPAGEDLNGPAFERVARSLLKQVTEALCRSFLPRPAATTAATAGPPSSVSRVPPPKVNVFLSHAKQDGTVPARRLRDYIYGQTQLAAFYDENDIAFGSVFSGVIQSGLGSPDTAAFIAIRSARYASRPWCRREVSSFRTPQPEIQSSNGYERWRIYPALVVEAMEGRQFSSGVPEFGNSPVIRWTDDDPGMEELIITTIIRDAMLASFHSALGASISPVENRIVINWLPDPTTLLHIPAVRSGSGRELLYPGRGLSYLELEILSEFFPQEQLTFRCFEEYFTGEVFAEEQLT